MSCSTTTEWSLASPVIGSTVRSSSRRTGGRLQAWHCDGIREIEGAERHQLIFMSSPIVQP